MRWAQKQRMEFIDQKIKSQGFINRKDLMIKFSISTPQASADFLKFQSLNMNVMFYNNKTKRYELVRPSLKTDEYMNIASLALEWMMDKQRFLENCTSGDANYIKKMQDQIPVVEYIIRTLVNHQSDISKIISIYEEERAKYIGGIVYYPNNQAAFEGAMRKAIINSSFKVILND